MTNGNTETRLVGSTIGELNGFGGAQWLKAGLDVLEKEGSARVPVDVLATHFGISKAAFYTKFKSRREFFDKTLEHWMREATEEFFTNPKLRALPPKDRLTKFARLMMNPDLARYEVTIAQLALQDETVARAIHEVNRARFDFVHAALEELGIDRDDLEMRARMFTCYVAWAGPMFRDMSLKRLRGLIGKQVEILTSQ